MRLCTLLTLFALTGCRSSAPAGVRSWQEPFFDRTPTAQWGYVQDGFQGLGEARELEGKPLEKLRSLLRTPAGEGPFKCIVHVDAELTAGMTTARVCTSCGVFLVDGKEWSVGDRVALLALLDEALGPRPPEPGRPFQSF